MGVTVDRTWLGPGVRSAVELALGSKRCSCHSSGENCLDLRVLGGPEASDRKTRQACGQACRQVKSDRPVCEAPGTWKGEGIERGVQGRGWGWRGQRAGPLTTHSSHPPSCPACLATWCPLLLLPGARVPTATAAPIPDAKAQDSLQSLQQGRSSLLLGAGERRTEKRGRGTQQERKPEGHREGRERYREGARGTETGRYSRTDEGQE